MGLDYYNILGITRNASTSDVKKAFRVLSIKYHPSFVDPNKADKKYEEICEAFEALVEPQRRAIYDQYGEDGLKHGTSATGTPSYFHPTEPEKVFAQYFGTDNPFAAALSSTNESAEEGRGIPVAPLKSATIERTVPVSLTNLYTGMTKKVKISKQVTNPDGKTTKLVEKILQLNIKAGWKSGTKLVFKNEGDEGPGIIPADIVFTVEEKPHPVFKRDNDNLIYTAKISLEKALTGTNMDIHTLDGRTLLIPISDVVTPSYVKTIPGEGLPNSKTGAKGDLLIRFDIEFPNSLTPAQKQLIKQAFTPATSNTSSA